MNHSELENLMFFMNTDGSVSAINKDYATKPGIDCSAFGPRTAPEPALMNLLISSPMLYQQLTLQYNALQALIDVVERLPVQDDSAKRLLTGFRQMQNGCLMAQSVAQEGIAKVAEGIEAENKYKKDIDNKNKKG